MEGKLRGSSVDGWLIECLIDHGKSAAVFRATRGIEISAVKIFDDELIARYGDSTQFERIKRELQLVGRHHPNLVKILGGGVDPITNNHYIVMEYLKGPNIKKCLQDIPADNIGSLIQQLAAAAQFLEDCGFVHRDIKPENIILMEDFTKLVLLDLGVARPLAGSTLTDHEGIQVFVGTLQYSSPEFLLREEDESTEGWRAHTYYQIGAVLHDLIMRKPLFDDFAQPYARLVNAVQHETPEIQNSAIPHYLVELARCCLLKNWRTRLRFVDWTAFSVPEKENISPVSFKQRVTNRGELTRAQALDSVKLTQDNEDIERKKLLIEIIDFMRASVRSIRAQNSVLPPIMVLPRVPNDNSFGVKFESSPTSGLPESLTMFIGVDIVETSVRLIEVSACGRMGAYTLGELGDACPQSVFQGTYDAQEVHAALERCIYDLIDQGQQFSNAVETEGSKWLKIREGS
jgi:serine/threonine protein kinase